MTVKGATSWSGTFVTLDATGAPAAASVGPAGTLYLNGTSNAASVTISGSNPYKWTLTLPALSAGDRVDMYVTATVGGIATAAIVASDAADTKRISDLNDIAATAIVSNGAITTLTGAVVNVDTVDAVAGLTFTVANQVDANVVDWKGAAAPAMTGDAYAVANSRLPAALTGAGNIKADALLLNGAVPNNLAAGAQMDLVNVPNATALAAIDTRLSVTHGAGAWGPLGTSGAFTIHIRAQDSSSLLYITDALISIKDNADTTLIDQQRTADDGTATRITTSLNAATYKLHCSVPGYASVVVSHVVSGNEDITLSLAPIVVGSPSAPNQCRVYGFEYTGVGGLPVLGSAVSAVLTGPSQVSGNNILEVQSGSTTSDASGYWYLDLTIGKTYKITIAQADIEIEIVVPNVASVNLKTLLI